MTTAAKPTYFPARGGTGRTENDLGSLSKQYSSRDLPSHTKIKYRQDGQGSANEVRNKDFKKDLEEKERTIKDKKHVPSGRKEGPSSGGSKDEVSRRQKSEPAQLALLDADDPTVQDDDDEEEEENGRGGAGGGSDDDDDDGDDLEMELNKIRKEREAEKAKLEEERKAEEERVRIENILSGNPLLNNNNSNNNNGGSGPADFRVKRRWDDDVIFKNCAREDDAKKPKYYINDTLRSEFHKKFMDKYIK